jgi:hypothetical protein
MVVAGRRHVRPDPRCVSEGRRARFAEAFYRQGRSDWQAYKLLVSADASAFWQAHSSIAPAASSLAEEVPACHSLHYLQMACEKIAKAYRLRDTTGDLDEITSKHTGFTKFINTFLRSPAWVAEFKGRDGAHQAVVRASVKFAREIEKLAPAVDRAAFPENVEYPWEAGGKVVSPCDYSYPALSFLGEPGGRSFLKTIDRAFRDFALTKIH